jgi:putative transposase
MARYHAPKPMPDPTAVVADTLESIAREGARAMLERMLAEEIDAFLGRARYAPGGCRTGYRNGYAREREVGIGTWSVPVRAPRVSDLAPGSPPFESAILHKRRYLSMETQRHFARLYLEGLSSGDFEPAMRELMGERATLSASTIIRLRAEWAEEYDAFRSRPITARHAYIWADGIYLGAGLEKLRGLRERGLDAPLLAVGDGALGLWAGLREVFPTTAHQRCWNHKAMNVLDRLPKRLQPEARARITAIWSSPTRESAVQERDATVTWLRGQGQADAAATLLRDWEHLVTFYDLPAEHWRHLRTSNVVESVFAGVRLRTDVAKRARVRERAPPRVQDRGAAGRLVAPAQRWGHADDPAAHRGQVPRRRPRGAPGATRDGGADGRLISRRHVRDRKDVSTRLDKSSKFHWYAGLVRSVNMRSTTHPPTERRVFLRGVSLPLSVAETLIEGCAATWRRLGRCHHTRCQVSADRPGGSAMNASLSSIQTSSRAWPRAALDDDRAREFAAIYTADGPDALPPLAVIATDGSMLLADGHHRLAAAQLAGLEELPVEPIEHDVGEAPEDVAYAIGLRASATSSKPLTRAEQRAAIRRLLGTGRGDREIARLVGVAHTTVSRIRQAGDRDEAEDEAARQEADADELARRLAGGLRALWQKRGLSDLIVRDRMGRRLASALDARFGDDAHEWALRLERWAADAAHRLEGRAER